MTGPGQPQQPAAEAIDLSPEEERALVALLSAPSQKDAAQVAGLSPRTLQRYLARPHFAQAYREARRAEVAAVLGQLQAVASKAVATLEAVLDDEEARPGERTSAAKAVLEFTARLAEVDDLAERVEAVEQALAKKQNSVQ